MCATSSECQNVQNLFREILQTPLDPSTRPQVTIWEANPFAGAIKSGKIDSKLLSVSGIIV
jgi:hypothetical protein